MKMALFTKFLLFSVEPAKDSRFRGVSFRPQGRKEFTMTTSWVIREKSTARVIAETFQQTTVDALNTSKYEAVPILEYLASLNAQCRK